MKAVFFKEHGGLNVLTYGEIPAPKIGSEEALIQVEACGLNHLDLWIRQGLPGISVPMPHIIGSEIVGKVIQMQSSDSSITIGSRVLVAPGISCGRCQACYHGQDSRCVEFKILGLQLQGGYAEQVVVPVRNLIPISDQLEPHEWAVVPLVFLTAWHMLMTRGGLKTGETVLIQAGGSGIGSAAIQVACLMGARVITTVGSDEKLKKAAALGAEIVVNYNKKDFVDEVSKWTHQRGVDLVFEHVGPATWGGSLRSLAKGGRLVTCGATTGPKVELDLRFFFTKELSVTGCYLGSRSELDHVLALIEQGKLKPIVDTVFPLKEAARAQEKMESRDFFGKLVLKI